MVSSKSDATNAGDGDLRASFTEVVNPKMDYSGGAKSAQMKLHASIVSSGWL